jgi:hypothetical protein
MGIGLTLQRLEGWEGQFECMVRFYERACLAANEGRSTDEMDFTLVVFQQALSLRDWVQATCPSVQNLLAALFRDNVEMRLCRDIANGFKHMEITKPSIDKEFSIVFEYAPWGGKMVVLGGGHQVGLLELAGQCVERWRAFIEANQLKPSSVAAKT